MSPQYLPDLPISFGIKLHFPCLGLQGSIGSSCELPLSSYTLCKPQGLFAGPYTYQAWNADPLYWLFPLLTLSPPSHLHASWLQSLCSDYLLVRRPFLSSLSKIAQPSPDPITLYSLHFSLLCLPAPDIFWLCLFFFLLLKMQLRCQCYNGNGYQSYSCFLPLSAWHTVGTQQIFIRWKNSLMRAF